MMDCPSLQQPLDDVKHEYLQQITEREKKNEKMMHSNGVTIEIESGQTVSSIDNCIR